MSEYRLKSGGGEGTKFSIDYEAHLNEAQYEAVSIVSGPVLVIAGAGTGKTRTLTYRVARLVEMGIHPSSILLLTFTRRAAEEMIRRASGLIDSRCEKVAGGTFHSFANMALRRHAGAVGFNTNYTILDEGDCHDLVGLLRSNLGHDMKEKRFPKKSTITDIFGKAVNKSTSIEEVLSEEYPQFFDFLSDLEQLFEGYSAYKARNNLMDYDDLLIYLKALLFRNEEIRNRLSDQFRYIMVDEYQDTNKIQAEIVRLLASAHDNVMVVGDDSQSIYSFRGANFRNIMDFPSDFPGTRIIKIEVNYRSTQPILNVTNRIIEGAAEKYTKVLKAVREGSESPQLVVMRTESAQSRFIGQKVLELREEGVPLYRIAVLFRSSFHSFDLELELNRRGIPFVKRGGMKLIEAAHIKDITAHLRVVMNPSDMVSWMRVLTLIEGIGSKKAHDIAIEIQKNDSPSQVLRKFQAKGKARAGLDRLASLMDEISGETGKPSEKLASVTIYYQVILVQKFDDYPKREKDLIHLSTICDNYRSLASFLTDMALDPPSESVSGLAAGLSEDERLILSTIHSAKGLEWHSVFVIWAVEGKFPSYLAEVNEDQMEEERRLMYVATTRAQENLFITYPVEVYDRNVGSVLSKPSRFISEIPISLFERVEVIEDWEENPGYTPYRRRLRGDRWDRF